MRYRIQNDCSGEIVVVITQGTVNNPQIYIYIYYSNLFVANNTEYCCSGGNSVIGVLSM